MTSQKLYPRWQFPQILKKLTLWHPVSFSDINSIEIGNRENMPEEWNKNIVCAIHKKEESSISFSYSSRSVRRAKNTRSICIPSLSILGNRMTLEREMNYNVQTFGYSKDAHHIQRIKGLFQLFARFQIDSCFHGCISIFVIAQVALLQNEL